MIILSINPLAIIATVVIILLLTAIWYGIQEYERDLKLFRENLRVGDMVTIKLKSGAYVRCRIYCRDSNNTMRVVEIDTRNQRLASVTQIYKP